MELCGRQYLIDHCFLAEETIQKEKAFKVYVTDTLKALNDAVADKIGGSVFNKRYIELIEFSNEKEQDPEEIIDRISNKLDKLGER